MFDNTSPRSSKSEEKEREKERDIDNKTDIERENNTINSKSSNTQIDNNDRITNINSKLNVGFKPSSLDENNIKNNGINEKNTYPPQIRPFPNNFPTSSFPNTEMHQYRFQNQQNQLNSSNMYNTTNHQQQHHISQHTQNNNNNSHNMNQNININQNVNMNMSQQFMNGQASINLNQNQNINQRDHHNNQLQQQQLHHHNQMQYHLQQQQQQQQMYHLLQQQQQQQQQQHSQNKQHQYQPNQVPVLVRSSSPEMRTRNNYDISNLVGLHPRSASLGSFDNFGNIGNIGSMPKGIISTGVNLSRGLNSPGRIPEGLRTERNSGRGGSLDLDCFEDSMLPVRRNSDIMDDVLLSNSNGNMSVGFHARPTSQQSSRSAILCQKNQGPGSGPSSGTGTGVDLCKKKNHTDVHSHNGASSGGVPNGSVAHNNLNNFNLNNGGGHFNGNGDNTNSKASRHANLNGQNGNNQRVGSQRGRQLTSHTNTSSGCNNMNDVLSSSFLKPSSLLMNDIVGKHSENYSIGEELSPHSEKNSGSPQKKGRHSNESCHVNMQNDSHVDRDRGSNNRRNISGLADKYELGGTASVSDNTIGYCKDDRT